MSLTRPLTRPLTRKISRAELTQGYGGSFSPLLLNPYLLFDARESMVGTLENPTLDLNPALPETLDVITATRAGVATYTDPDGNIATASADTVRVDHVDGVPMILVEPSATNSFLYSQPTSALAFGGGGIRTFDAATAPNGETEAFRITNNGTSGNDNYRATSSITFGSDFMVLSVWAKAGSGGNNYFTWSFQNLGGAVVRAGFRLEGDGETQLITSGNGGHTLQIETYPDGWYRCIIIGNTQSSGTTTQFLYSVSGYTEHSSNAGGSVLLWGFQVEAGSVATSYIPTSGGDAAARTRAADDLVISGSAFTDFYNQSEGTFYAESIESQNSVNSFVLDANNGFANYIEIFNTGSDTKVVLKSGGTPYVNKVIGNRPSTGVLSRVALSYETNNVSASIDGINMSPDTSATMSTVINKLIIGADFNFANQLNGHIKRLIYWPYHSDSL